MLKMLPPAGVQTHAMDHEHTIDANNQRVRSHPRDIRDMSRDERFLTHLNRSTLSGIYLFSSFCNFNVTSQIWQIGL